MEMAHNLSTVTILRIHIIIELKMATIIEFIQQQQLRKEKHIQRNEKKPTHIKCKTHQQALATWRRSNEHCIVTKGNIIDFCLSNY